MTYDDILCHRVTSWRDFMRSFDSGGDTDKEGMSREGTGASMLRRFN